MSLAEAAFLSIEGSLCCGAHERSSSVYGSLRTEKRENREKERNYVKQKLNGNWLCKDCWFTIWLFLSTHHPPEKRRFAGRHRYQRSVAVIDSQAPATSGSSCSIEIIKFPV
jgi:hypothetical protein